MKSFLSLWSLILLHQSESFTGVTPANIFAPNRQSSSFTYHRSQKRMTFRRCQQPSSTSINLSDNAERTETTNEISQTEGMKTNKPASLQLDAAKQIIAKAISIGAPAYNSGDIQKCADVYRAAAVEIIPFLPPNLKKSLESTMSVMDGGEDGSSGPDATEEAWAFRRQFDSILEHEVPFMPGSENDKYTLEKFTERMVNHQPSLIINDNVMGGVSQSQWIQSSKTFTGSTSLRNNGGFASIRWRLDPVQNWSYAKGIYLKVQHSNPAEHTFRIIVKDMTCDRMGGPGANYKNVFCDPDQSGDAILIPFDAFDSMESMGRQIGRGPMNRSAVTELGIMAIKPSVVGDFELNIEEWGLYY